jgi:hypothetical protein
VLLWIEGIPSKIYGIIFACLTAISFMSSYLFFNKSAGSIWCHYSAFLPIIYSFIRIFT